MEYFQRISECVDLVHRDDCVSRISDPDANPRTDGYGSREAMAAAIYQAAAASEIEGLGVDVGPWMCRWNSKANCNCISGGIHRLRRLGIRIAHKRILGIPIRLYDSIEGALNVNKRNEPELISLGANWFVPKTKGHVALNISSTCKHSSFNPSLRPNTLDATVRCRVHGLGLDIGCILAHPLQANANSVKDMRIVGATMGIRMECVDVNVRKGARLLGFSVFPGRKKQTKQQEQTPQKGESTTPVAKVPQKQESPAEVAASGKG